MLKLQIQNNKKSIFIPILLLILASVFCSLIGNNHMEIFLLTICLIYIFRAARFSYFTIFSFILWFSFLQEYFASISPMLSSGRLAWDTSVPIYHKELFVCTMFFFLVELLIFYTTRVLENEKELYRKKIPVKRQTAKLYALIALVLVLLAYPTLPTLGAKLSRDNGILPSSLVVPLACLMLAVTYDYVKQGLYFKVLMFLSLFWIVFHGDRVIVLGFLIYILLKYMNNGKFDYSTLKSIIFNKRTIVVCIAVVVVVVISIKVQITRGGNTYSLTYTELIQNIVKQGTAGDVVFGFNCSTDMWKTGNGMHGYTYLYYLSNILPSADPNMYPANVLLQQYNTLGGGLFFVEPMMNGGIILTFLHTTIFLCIITFIYNRKTEYSSFLIIPFVLLIFRFTWYASLAGLVKMVLYYVPLLYLGAKKVQLR